MPCRSCSPCTGAIGWKGMTTVLEIQPLGKILAAQGYTVVAMDYRLLPKYHYPAPLEDVRAAARWVQAHADTYHFDLRRLTVLGISAGSQLAALLALRPSDGIPPFAGVVDICGPMDLTVTPTNPFIRAEADHLLTAYLGARREKNPHIYAEASPITYVTRKSPAFLIIHGTADNVVPYSQAIAMTEALKAAGAPVTSYPIVKGKHGAPLPNTQAGKKMIAAMITFLQRCRLPEIATQ